MRETYTNDNLADHDTDNLKVGHRENPILATDLMSFPTFRPHFVEKRLQVSYREQDVAFEAKACTGDNGMSSVPCHRGKRISFGHVANGFQFFLGFLAINL